MHESVPGHMPAQSANTAAFGRAVRQLRVERTSLSQEALAHRCGMDRSYVGGIERGERNVALENILKLADGLGVTPAELMDRYSELAGH